jgi:hypothetical protein
VIGQLSSDDQENIAFYSIDLPRAIAGDFGSSTLQPCDIDGNPTSTRHGSATAMADLEAVAGSAGARTEIRKVMAARNGTGDGNTQPYRVTRTRVLGGADWPHSELTDCRGTKFGVCWDLIMSVMASDHGMAALSTQSARATALRWAW